MNPPAAALKSLILAGGGHAHVEVLRRFGSEPPPGARLTLISRDDFTAYSGMIPGYVAGHYTFKEAHIDLRPLAQYAGATFLRGRIIGIDLPRRRVLIEGGEPVPYDVLSINTGSTPRLRDVPGAAENVLPVKPIDRFLAAWDRLDGEIVERGGRPLRVAVVGGGAGGVELVLAARHRLKQALAAAKIRATRLDFHLVTASTTILPAHNQRVRSKLASLLRARDVQVHLDHHVVGVEPGFLRCSPGRDLAADTIIWATQADAPEWAAVTGLQTDAAGFVAVADTLQSMSHPGVFAAGDIAAVLNHPCPKAGVFAVRQGEPLAGNLHRALAGEPLLPFIPQKEALALIGAGDKYAVASRGRLTCAGAWVWRLKERIDRRWMRQYQILPPKPHRQDESGT